MALAAAPHALLERTRLQRAMWLARLATPGTRHRAARPQDRRLRASAACVRLDMEERAWMALAAAPHALLERTRLQRAMWLARLATPGTRHRAARPQDRRLRASAASVRLDMEERAWMARAAVQHVF